MSDFAPFEFRPFEASDTGGLIEMIGECYQDYGETLELETLDADLPQILAAYGPPHAFQVLVAEARVIGSVALKRSSGPVELKRLFLKREFRGRGLGKKMTLWAFDWARHCGETRMHFWSDVLFEEAHALYRHLGADDTGTRRHLGGVNDCYEYYFTMKLGG